MNQPTIVSFARGDVTGDRIPDHVYLTGIKTLASPFTQNITLHVQDGRTGAVKSVLLRENAGYNPTLFLGDFGSMLPGQGGHVLLSGHRDTVFRKLEGLKIGDEITFSTPYGDFIYEATDFKIVEANDETVAVPTDHETLTLTTCYPFNFIGDAPQRYIVYTKLKTNPLDGI
jgi:LPXTG-site transpeptidase (sortase) family protein